MLKFKKLLVASLALAASVFFASICAYAAQIDSLSIVDNTIYATATAENSRLYAAEYNGGLLSDVFFKDISEDGSVELPVGEASEYTLYLWDKETLAPVSATYKLTDGVAYMEGSSTPVPEYDFSAYSFNQDDNVMVVSEISTSKIKGFKGGEEVTYVLTDSVTVVGLSDSIADVVPGSVVLIGTTKAGECGAIELLASIGIPVNQEVFEGHFGVYNPSDGSTKYQNIVTEMFAKSGNKLTTFILNETGGKTAYTFEQKSPCHRVGIAMLGDTPIITATNQKIDDYPSIFEKTNEYHNYLYIRYDTEKGKAVECVYYCVPKNFDPGKGDGEYSDIFNLEPIVIID